MGLGIAACRQRLGLCRAPQGYSAVGHCTEGEDIDFSKANSRAENMETKFVGGFCVGNGAGRWSRKGWSYCPLVALVTAVTIPPHEGFL